MFPAQYSLRNELATVLGSSPSVTVLPAMQITSTKFEIRIKVSNTFQAQAIRQILEYTHSFGRTIVNVTVYDNSTGKEIPPKTISYPNVKSLANLFCTDLLGNPYFVGIILTEGKISPPLRRLIGDIVVLTTNQVLEIPYDNIGDLCGYYNEVSSNAFSKLLIPKFLTDFIVGFEVYHKSCERPCDMYCINKFSNII